MKLLLDEMLSPGLAVQLRSRGYDVIGVSESPELRQLPDSDILEFAVIQRRSVVTRNIADFRILARSVIDSGGQHPGIVYISNRQFPEGDQHVSERIANALVTKLNVERDLTNNEIWLR